MAYKWRALLAVCFGTFLATMDFSVVNVALPELSRTFDRSPDTVVWATLASNLVVTGLTLTAGRVGDLFGRKRVYITGWAIFSTGMALASLSGSIEQLIAARVFQAMGVALVIATGNAIVASAFPANERGRSIGITGAVVGAGIMSGPVLGGLLIEAFDWHAIFWARAPLGLIAMLLAFFLIRESRGGETTRRIDVPGALLLFVALAGTLTAVNRGGSLGWASPVVLGLLVTGAASLFAFIRVELRVASPIVDITLFRVRSFAASIAALVLQFIGQSAVGFLIPFYYVSVRETSTAHAGLVLATVPCIMLFLAPLSGVLFDRHNFRFQTAIGSLFVAAGLASLATISATTPDLLVIARLALIGVGSALFGAPNNSTVMNSVPPARLGMASASLASGRNIGNAAGLAAWGAILAGVATSSAGLSGVSTQDLPPAALLDGIQAGFVAAAVVASLAIAASLVRVSAGVPRPARPPSATREAPSGGSR